MTRTKKTKKPQHPNSNNKLKPCNPGGFIMMPIIPISTLHEKIEAKEITHDELYITARTYAFIASDLWSDNKHVDSLQHALIAAKLYRGLAEHKYPFAQNEHEFIKLAENIINQYKSLKK